MSGADSHALGAPGAAPLTSRFATENYLKSIVAGLARSGKESIATGEVAKLLGVTSGTATVMVQKLHRQGYLRHRPRRGSFLTAKGRAYGLRVLRRHRLLEAFLVKTLDLDWSDVHEEAESLEHAASDRLIDAMDSYLDYPTRDPHGDPIPSRRGDAALPTDTPLSALPAGQRAELLRVEGDRAALAYFRSQGLLPGSTVSVLRREAEAGVATLRVGGRTVTVALSVLGGIFVQPGSRGDASAGGS